MIVPLTCSIHNRQYTDTAGGTTFALFGGFRTHFNDFLDRLIPSFQNGIGYPAGI
jgi:hypothetical protein